LADAERLYRSILETDPDHADSWHLLGVIATQRGAHQDAILLIGHAITRKSRIAPFHANLGSALRAAGRLEEAVESYRRALSIDAAYAEGHNNLGTALRDLDQMSEAEKCFRESVRLKPQYGDAYNNLGNLLRETGRAEESLACYQRALEVAPLGHPKTMQYNANLGAVLRELGQYGDAEGAFRRALRVMPNAPEAHVNLGLALRDQGRFEEADLCFCRALLLMPEQAEHWTLRAATLRQAGSQTPALVCCARALQLDPTSASALATEGIVQLDFGDQEAARRKLAAALHASPDNAYFHYNLSEMKKFRPEDAQIRSLEALWSAADQRPVEDRVYLGFAFAKALDDIGEKDRAFDVRLDANRLKRSTVSYDEMRERKQIADIIATFTPALMSQKMPPLGLPTGPILILGMPRSGSTLVEQILASHPDVFGAGEVRYFRRALGPLRAIADYPLFVPGLARGDFDRLAAHYNAALSSLSPEHRRVTDKQLSNFLYCGLIRLAVPTARIIHTRRDPIDTCLSIFSKMFAGNIPYAYDLGELGRYYHAYRDLMTHWRGVIEDDFMIDVDYESVVDDLEGAARRIIAHCGLAWDDQCLDFHRTNRTVMTASATQVREPIYRTSVGRWQPAQPLLAPLLEALG
jgi:tetratricopeptide (TPR) repeat protein